ncbi:MAG: exodeoxyribonuclease VII small subunit [Flavobacteriales bacterium]
MSENNSYATAMHELQDIVRRIEQGDIGIDDLSAQVKRASVLIEQCRAKLRSTETDIQSILQNLEKGDAGAGSI